MNRPDPWAAEQERQETWQHQTTTEVVKHHVYRKKVPNRADNPQVMFFGHLAKEHGIHLAALVFHVAKWTDAKVRDGRSAHTYDPTWAFADALGVSPRQVSRLIRRAQRLKLLDWQRGVNCIRLYLVDKQLYKVREGNTWYHRDLAALIGMTESLLYRVIVEYTVNVPDDRPLPGFAASYGVWQTMYPFLTQGAIRNALSKLTKAGLIRSDWEGTHHLCQSRRYYATEAQAGLCGKALKLTLGTLPSATNSPSPSAAPSALRRSRAAAPDAAGPKTKQYRPGFPRRVSCE